MDIENMTSTSFDHAVIIDLTVGFPDVCDRPSRSWRRIEKDLHLYTTQRGAWVFVALAEQATLTDEDLVVTDIRIGPPSEPATEQTWQSRPGGLYVRRNAFLGEINRVVTAVDILYGVDAVEPRPHWTLLRRTLQLDLQQDVPAARLTIRHGRSKASVGIRKPLRIKEDGKFKIVQVSDAHMVTGVGSCKDAIDANGKYLPTCEADPLTVRFIKHILDLEKPDLVVFTGDQLHHDILDSQSALFKLVAPMIERSIPFTAVFGNHDSEGPHAMTRAEQMSLLEDLPFSLCEAGPAQVEGVGNSMLRILAPAPSQVCLATLFLLDSHGQVQSSKKNPDYDAIKQSQIDWFKTISGTYRDISEGAASSGLHLSIAFQHIPVPEFADQDLSIYKGDRREPSEGPSFNSHFYDALAGAGVSALACGHDHVNDFCALLPQRDEIRSRPGPWLCYGGAAGFGGYCSYGKRRFHRRMRVWEFEPKAGCLKTWQRVEYAEDRRDEMMLVAGGAVIRPPVEARWCTLS